MSIVSNPFFVSTGTSLFLALFFTMIACLILGMGVPTTANYVIMATICAPMVIRTGAALNVGIPILAAHMFVFYFGIIADITPPVALAAYAGAAIAKCDPIKAGLTATKLAIAAFIVPYVFIFNPGMLLIGGSVLKILQAILSTSIGMVGIAVGLSGFMFRKVTLPWRFLAIVGGLLLIDAGGITDLIGLILIASMTAVQLITWKREKSAIS